MIFSIEMGKEFNPHARTTTNFIESPFSKKPPHESESILKTYLGDRRFQLTGMSAGILQLMHPVVGDIIEKQSNFFERPWDRILNSVPEILGGLYDADSKQTGRRIRDYHKDLRAIDLGDGKKHHALGPDIYSWPHLTFVKMTEDVIDRFDRRELAPEERETFYQESVAWYRNYGLSMKPIPKDYASYRAKLDEMYEHQLHMTPAAEDVITKVSNRTIEPRPGLLTLTARLGFRAPINEVVRLLAIGGLPPIVRERFAIKWSRADELKLKSMEETTKRLWPLVPDFVSYHPRARAGMKSQHTSPN